MTVRAGGAIRAVAPVAASLMFVFVIAWLSFAPMPPSSSDAVVRLSWRTQPFRVELCRTLSADEQAALAAHMRRTEECTGRFVDYEVTLDIDGAATVDTVSPSGARRDRPVYVFQDAMVEPGTHDVAVRFTALYDASGSGEGGSPRGGAVGAGDDGIGDVEVPAPLEWRGSVTLSDREIALVTLDRTGTRLVRFGQSVSPSAER
jgi:hypothetical protein